MSVSTQLYWSTGAVPVVVHLGSNMHSTQTPPDPVIFLLPRCSLLLSIAEPVRLAFRSSIPEEYKVDDLWLEKSGNLIHWHLPVGVIADMSGDCPLVLIARFDKAPIVTLMPTAKETNLFIANLFKQGVATLTGETRAFLELPIEESAALMHIALNTVYPIPLDMMKKEEMVLRTLWSKMSQEMSKRDGRCVEEHGRVMCFFHRSESETLPTPIAVSLSTHKVFGDVVSTVTGVSSALLLRCNGGLQETLESWNGSSATNSLHTDPNAQQPVDELSWAKTIKANFVVQGLLPPMQTPLLTLFQNFCVSDFRLHVVVRGEWKL